METVNTGREFGNGGREIVSSKVGAAEGTAKKANASSDFRGGVAVRGEEVKCLSEGSGVSGREKRKGRCASGRRKEMCLLVVDNDAVRATKSREAIQEEKNVLMGKKGGSVVKEGKGISARHVALGGACSKFMVQLREDDIEDEGGKDRT